MSAEPRPRYCHFSAAAKRQFYVYGGVFDSEDGEPPQTINVFSCDSKEWKQTTTTEGTHPPPDLYNGACTSMRNLVFLQGGRDKKEHYNTLYQLDYGDLKWTKLSSADDQGAPMAKQGHGMVYHHSSHSLVVFGGWGLPPTGLTRQPGAEYQSHAFLERVYTNELHVFNLQKGKWSSPAVTGTRPPPCHKFSLTMVGDRRAVLFGGYGKQGRFKHLYVLDIAKMHWSRIYEDEGGTWPERRNDHAAVCLGIDGDHPQLLITGGFNGLGSLDDAWTLDLKSWNWRKVEGHSLKPRWSHSAAAFTITQEVTEVIMFGGVGDDELELSDTTVLRFEWLEQPNFYGPPTQEWVLAGEVQIEISVTPNVPASTQLPSSSPPLDILTASASDRVLTQREDHLWIMKKLIPNARKWRRIGEGLGFIFSELSSIEAKPMLLVDAPESFLREMLADWLEWAPGDSRGSTNRATLSALRTAVRQAGLGCTALEL